MQPQMSWNCLCRPGRPWPTECRIKGLFYNLAEDSFKCSMQESLTVDSLASTWDYRFSIWGWKLRPGPHAQQAKASHQPSHDQRASPLPTSARSAVNPTRHPAKTSSSAISDSQRAVSSRLETTPTPSLTSSHLTSECLIKSATAHLTTSFGRDHIEQDYSVRM